MRKRGKIELGKRIRKDNKHKGRFTHYASSELVALSLDLVLLWAFISVFRWNYLFSVGLAYMVAITVHYYGVRKRVFHGSVRDPFHSYSYFLAVGIFGFAITLGIVFLSITFINSSYFLSRAFAAVLVVPSTYTLNHFITFIMPKPLPKSEDYCNIPDVRNK
jgi:putative flippase GtrA